MTSIKASLVYVVQVAQLEGKGGFAEHEEGAWIEHDVFLDREEAESRARILETSPKFDETGRDVSQERFLVARVITAEQLGNEFGQEREDRLLTVFRKRLTDLTHDNPPQDD
jgi:hypothetical protein